MARTFLFFLVLFIPLGAYAAEFHFTEPYDTIHAGDQFAIDLYLDPQGQSVNALEGGVSFSPNIQLVETRIESSIVPLWIQKPTLTKGIVSFAGVIPSGYEGSLSPEWKGFRPGKVLRLIFEATKEGHASVFLGSATKAYLNDGKGTPAQVNALGFSFDVLPRSDSLRALSVALDSIQPEPFTPLRVSGTSFGEKNDMLVFTDEDKQSGVNHFEIAFSKTEVSEHSYDQLSFVNAESPYPLPPESLSEFIYVKAVDEAGNERLALVKPESAAPFRVLERLTFLILGGLFVFALFLFERLRGYISGL